MPYTTTNTDLVALIEQRATVRLKKHANHRQFGPEYIGACPFCKVGKDRFHVWPSGARPHYWCRVCDATGSAPWFLVQYCNMSFADACQELGIELEEREGYTPPSFSEVVARDDPPPQKWQDAARVFVERAECYLWHSPKGKEVLAYLRKRGLTDDTIRGARLGYCPAHKDGSWHAEPFDVWGIDPASVDDEEKRKRGTVVIPPGIIIPWFDDDRIWKVAVKRPGLPKGEDYGQVLGSREGMYNISSVQFDKPAMLVESELCALSVMQEAGDLLACVATGSVYRGRRARWIADLGLASFVLQSFDNDAAGDENAPYWIKRPEFKGRCIRWSPMPEKDPNDILKALGGESLRNWVRWGMYAWENAQDLDSIPELPESAHIPPEVSQGTCPELALYESHAAEQPEGLHDFATTVSQIVTILGGPQKVTISKHEPGLTMTEHLQRSGIRSHPVPPARTWGR